MNEQIKIVNQIIDNKDIDEIKHTPQIYLVNAIFYTVSFNNLVELYIETNNSTLRQILKYHLSRRLNDKNINLNILFNKLIKRIDRIPYRKHQRIRLFLSEFVEKLPKKYIQKYYDYFSSTGYVHDLSAALKVSKYVWNNEFDQIYLNEYYRTGDERYLYAVIQNGKLSSVYENLSDIWYDDYPQNYIKNQILRKIAPEYMHKLDFLIEAEPDKYLYALSFSDREIADELVIKLYEKLKTSQKTFGLWCIGKLGKWHLLKNYLEISR